MSIWESVEHVQSNEFQIPIVFVHQLLTALQTFKATEEVKKGFHAKRAVPL